MQKRAGTFIVIEGTDGSGKGAQFELLCDRLRQAGYEIATFDFPQYDSPSSYFVKQYLNGEYGGGDEVGPYTASLFYALDRYEAAPQIKQALDQGKVVVSNRFTGSSMGHQGTKFRSPEERRGYFIWLDNLEFEMLQIPRPDISFVLRVPAEIAQTLVDRKAPRTYTDKKRDIHEEDLEHLKRSVEVYDDLTQLFPKDFQRIDCLRNDKLLDINTVQNMLWEKITPLLPPPPQLELSTKDIPSSAAAAMEPAPAVSENVDEPKEMDEPEKTLETEAARPEAAKQGTPQPAGNFREVTGQHFVVEGASNLLAQRLEDSRLAAYVQESNAIIDYTQKDDGGNYKYYTPKDMSALATQQYHASMGQIFELYTQLVDALTQAFSDQSDTPKNARGDAWKAAIRARALEAASPVLPAAAVADVVVLAFGQALEGLVTDLLSDQLPELRTAGEALLRDARAISPTFLETADQSESGNSPITYRASTFVAVEALAKKFLPENHAAETIPVQLAEGWPRNELDLLPDILYEHSSLPLATLRAETAEWPYSRKLDLFEAYLGQRKNRRQQPGRALEKAHYTWDIVSSYAVFRDLERQRLIDHALVQPLTPRYGYTVPAIIETAGLTEDFEQCFDLSLELYSLLQEAGHPLEAQYATLLGHKTRWKLTHTALDALRLLARPLAPEAAAILDPMRAKLAEIHPLIAEAIQT